MPIRIKIPRVADVQPDMDAKGITFYMIHKNTPVKKSAAYRFKNNKDVSVQVVEWIVEYINDYKKKK